MGVEQAIRAELDRLGPDAYASVEGQTALALAGVLDDRAGIQNGGSASTAKQLLATMDTIRDRYKPVQRSALKLLQGDGLA
jgi:hypothetical protein